MPDNCGPCRVTVNLLTKPYGVDRTDLTFSFRPGEALSACRFVFAASRQALTDGDYLLDTGLMETTQTCGIRIPGLARRLAPDSLYFGQVQTRNEKGAISPFSDPFCFFTAAETWQAEACWAAGEPDFCLLRHTFTLSERPAKAFVQMTADSPEPIRQYVYHLLCNGRVAALGPTRTGRETDRAVLYYETVDVTDLLQAGENCLAAVCYTTAGHRFACRLITADEAGNTSVLCQTPADWQAMDATPLFCPDRSIGTNYYFAAAENINGEVWPVGWEQPGYRGDGFHPAGSRGRLDGDFLLRPYPAPPVERYEQPVSLLEEIEENLYFADLGREIIGGLRLTLTTDRPLDLTLRFGEELDEAGRVRYKMRTGNVYEEHWRLAAGKNDLCNFGMKTFRYVEIEGLPCGVGEDAVRGLAYRAPFEENASYFTGSSELLNAVYDLCKYTIQATNQHVYVDSQSRERCAYEGDVLINMLTAAAVSDSHALTRFSLEYLYTHRTWPAEYVLFCIVMARLDYLYTGDRASLERYYPLLRDLLYWRQYDSAVGLLKNPTMAGNVTDAVLVDWPGTERDGYAYSEAVYNTVFNAVQYKALRDLAWIARQLDHPDDGARFASMAADLQAAMIRTLYDPATGAFRDGLREAGDPVDHFAQHATAFALYAGVYDSPAMADKMAGWLAEHGAIRTSVYGAFFLLEGLYHAGRGDAANALLLSEDVSRGARTWAYMLDKLDATITTEAWNTANKGNMTWSHPWGSAAGAEIVRGLFGIRPLTPGFAEFSVDLQPAGLRYGAVQAPTVKGPVTAAFDLTRSDCPVTLTLTVPAGTTAQVTVPAPCGLTVYDNGRPVSARAQDGRYAWAAAGGEHQYEIR